MKIGVVAPTYNEEGNVLKYYERITKIFREDLPEYDYEILYVDNKSTDRTREILEELCRKDKHVKCIFNVCNFGYLHNSFYAMTQSDGDATFMCHTDMQDPPEMLPQFVREWRAGTSVVVGVKEGSPDPKWILLCRKLYFTLIGMVAQTKQIAHFNNFGVYDRSFIETLRQLDDRDPYMQNLVAQYASSIKTIPYKQDKRTSGKGSTNFLELYDYAMIAITSTSKIPLRICTFVGALISAVSFIFAIAAMITKLANWSSFQPGISAISTGMFFLGGVQLFFLGILGEYILTITTQVLHRPVVVEEKRINFDEQKTEKTEIEKSKDKPEECMLA